MFTLPILFQLLLGLALSALMGAIGYRRGSLSGSGVLGAVLVGTLVFGLGGLAWGALLVVFFFSSSALSHFKEARKAAVAEKFSKGSTVTTQTNHFFAAVCGYIKLELLKRSAKLNHFALKPKLYLAALHVAFDTLRQLQPVCLAA